MGAVWVRAQRTLFPTDRQPQAKTPSVSVLQHNFEFFLSIWTQTVSKAFSFDANSFSSALLRSRMVCAGCAAEVWCEHNKMQKAAPTYSQETLLKCCWQKDGQECDAVSVQVLTSSRTVMARATRNERSCLCWVPVLPPPSSSFLFLKHLK